MKTRKISTILAAAICLLSLAGCKENEPAPATTASATQTSSTKAVVTEDTKEFVTTTQTEAPTSEVTYDSSGVWNTSSIETDAPATEDIKNEPSEVSIEEGYDKYYRFMVEHSSSDENAVFSPESINAAFDIYSELLNSKDKAVIDAFIGGRAYFDYQSNDVFKIVNRLWYNQNEPLNIDANSYLYTSGIAYGMDMSDSAKATDEKNRYVSENTNGFIDSTPTIFNELTLFDAMNIVYFKDTWFGGNKSLDTYETDFHNSDGTVTPVYMMRDSSSGVYETDKAYSYTLDYENGFTMTVLLPKDGVYVSDISIDDFINGNTEWVAGECRFSMPEFETKCTYQVGMTDFGLNNYIIREDIYDEATDPAEISQVAKIRVDHEGTEAAAVSEIIVNKATAIAPSEPFIFMCDKPFAYYITDTLNDDIAFIGIVNKL